MNSMVLMVIDMQNTLVESGPFNIENVVDNISSLIKNARSQGIEVIYIQHDDGVGSDLEDGTYGWEIYKTLLPHPDEKVFKKYYNSAFYKTDLHAYLQSKDIKTIVLTGMQTEYCIDATLRSAFDLCYEIRIPENTNTTFDNEFLSGDKLFQYHNYKIWANRFAKLIPVEEAFL